MDSCFDSTIPTKLCTPRNIRWLIALIMFWFIGAIFPLIFWPKSYAIIARFEHKRFPKDELYKFDRHLLSNEVYEYINKFAKFHEHKAKVYTLAPLTYEGRSIKVLHLKSPRYFDDEVKGTILVVAAVAATMWDSVSAALDIMHKLCEGCAYKKYMQNYDWYIIPIYNPDGYDYSITIRDINLNEAKNPKNRVLHVHPNNPRECKGVYLERNFGFHWGESKQADYNNFCWSGFAGMYPFSENETNAFTNFISDLYKRNERITMVLQLHGHSFRDDITYPWRFTEQDTFNQPILHKMGKNAAKEVNKLTGSSFTSIQSGKRDLASGVLNDYLMGINQVLYAFCIEANYEIFNSSDVPNQELYIEKARTLVFSLAEQLKFII